MPQVLIRVSRWSLGLLGVLICAGCTSTPWSFKQAIENSANPSTEQSEADSTSPAPPVAANAEANSAHSLQQVLAEVEAMGSVDPSAQARLMAELKQADPQLWPLVAQNFRSRLALAGELRDKEIGPPNTPTPIQVASAPQSSFGEHSSQRQVETPTDANATALSRNSATPVQSPPVALAGIAGPATKSPNIAAHPTPPRVVAGPSEPEDDQVIRLPVAEPTALLDPSSHVTPAVSKSSTAPPPVVPASFEHPSAHTWTDHVNQAIRLLEHHLGDSATTDSDVANHARLHLLRLVAGQREAALREIPAAAAAVRGYWTNQLYGLDLLLDTEPAPQQSRRAAQAKRQLVHATGCLGELATLEVRNLAFCREIQSYGAIEQFEQNEFAPSQRVLLYAEVENFLSEDTPRGHHTQLRSRYQIFDAAGSRVAENQSTVTEEYCTNPRRDYFIGCEFCLPTRIYPGRHTLKLTVEDLKSQKIGESTIEFTVK